MENKKTKMKNGQTIRVYDVLWLIAGVVLGIVGGGGVAMCAASTLPDGGKTVGGDGVDASTDVSDSGVATATQAHRDGDPQFLQKDIDQKIMKIRPMSTPVENISRGIPSKSIDSMITKYYSVGTRPVKTTLTAAVEAQTSGESVVLDVADANLFTVDDTIRVVGVKAVTDEKGKLYDAKQGVVPDLELCVCGFDNARNMPVVYAVNGVDHNGQSSYVPAIPAGTTLIRMGKACSEIDAQTGLFTNLPTAEEQYCQNYMIQIEQSTFMKLWKKEVEWDWNDMEEEAVYDMKLTREMSSLFGAKNVIRHPSKKNQETYFTRGIWWMAGKDVSVGSWKNVEEVQADGTKKVVQKFEISDDDLVDISKDLFVGCATSGRKVLFCGSELLQALSKIKSDKFRLKETVEQWNLKFKSWQTDFGEILTIHHELFNECGMADCGLAIEPDYLDKRVFIPYSRSVKDFKTSGIRNTDGVVLQEVSCLVLKNAKAHARVRLEPKP